MKKTWMFLALSIALSSCSSMDQDQDEQVEKSDIATDSVKENSSDDIVEDTLADEAEELSDTSSNSDKKLNSSTDFENELSDATSETEANTNLAEIPSTPSDSEPANVSSQPLEIRNIKYVSFENGGTVVVEGNREIPFRLKEVPNRKQVILEIDRAILPKKLKRPFITKDFQQNVASINAFQESEGGPVQIIVQLKKMDKLEPQKEGNSLLLVSNKEDSSLDSRAVISDLDEGSNPARQEEDIRNEADEGSDELSVRGAVTKGFKPQKIDLVSTLKFAGKPISLEVSNAEIKDVLELIADQAGANLIVDDTVKGSVSIKLRQVPWDQALHLILKTKNLGYRTEGAVLRITTQDVLAREEQERQRVKDEELKGEPIKVKVIPVSFAKVKDLEDKVKKMLSVRGTVSVDEGTSSVIVSDIEEYVARAQRLVRALDAPPRQVLIEGRIIEAREGFERNMGLNLGIAGTNMALSGNANLAANAGRGTSTGNPEGLAINLRAGTFDALGDITAALTLYERNNEIKIISSPRITTINNKAAIIKQVTQIPITNIQPTVGAPIAKTEFKDVELKLEVNPQITFDQNVILQVNVKREFAGPIINPNTGAREINSREANTSVLVHNGETAVIGGVYQSDASESSQGIPVLKDIPIVGNLFKSTSKSREKNELLIFLTPRVLVEPPRLDKAEASDSGDLSL